MKYLKGTMIILRHMHMTFFLFIPLVLLSSSQTLSCRRIALQQGFSTSALLAFWARSLFVLPGRPVYWLVNSTPGFYALGAGSTSPTSSCNNQTCLRTSPHVLRGTKSPLVKNHCYMGLKIHLH